jgi:hypothetical protein
MERSQIRATLADLVEPDPAGFFLESQKHERKGLKGSRRKNKLNTVRFES